MVVTAVTPGLRAPGKPAVFCGLSILVGPDSHLKSKRRAVAVSPGAIRLGSSFKPEEIGEIKTVEIEVNNQGGCLLHSQREQKIIARVKLSTRRPEKILRRRQ